MASFLVPAATISALLALLLRLPTTAAQQQPLTRRCPADVGGNYTANSTFQANLNLLFASLSSNASSLGGYADSTAGAPPNRAYGLALCRGDATASICKACLDVASIDILDRCPLKKAAVIWYDNCLLRYSDQRFLSNPDTSWRYFKWNNRNTTPTEASRFNTSVRLMMDGLVAYAVSNASEPGLYAAGEIGFVGEYSKIYGLVQCTRDLSAAGCDRCLRFILGDLARYDEKVGGRTLAPSCQYRYEVYKFDNGNASVSLLPISAAAPGSTTAPAMVPVVPPVSTGSKRGNRTGTALAATIPVVMVIILTSLCCICVQKRKARSKKKYNKMDEHMIPTAESPLLDLRIIRIATANFSEYNKLGEGGFGAVYKGVLPDGQAIAVKRLSASSQQGIGELKNEVLLLAKLKHKNLVMLLGVCLEGEEKLLVYEYVTNKSLDTILFDAAKKEQLNWKRRFSIIVGIARGLLYLHEESQVKVIHRDLKASNVLLDDDMNPKISDFGMARLFEGEQTQALTRRVVGTFGYMPPEYVREGKFSNKSDVFSFGILILEIVTGRTNSDFIDAAKPTSLLNYVWENWMNRSVLEILDPSLRGNCLESEALSCIQIGLLCVQEAPADRPTMSSIVLMLSSHSVTVKAPSRPAFLIGYSQVRTPSQRDESEISRDGEISGGLSASELTSRT